MNKELDLIATNEAKIAQAKEALYLLARALPKGAARTAVQDAESHLSDAIDSLDEAEAALLDSED